MAIVTILIIFFIAIALLFVELLLIPGFGIAGISSIVLIISGILLTYKYYGVLLGNVALVGSIVFSIAFIVIALRQNTWKFLALKTDIDSKAPNNQGIDLLVVGNTGVAKTRLGPMGEIEVNGIVVEAQTSGSIIDAGTEIEIVQKHGHKIIVIPKKS